MPNSFRHLDKILKHMKLQFQCKQVQDDMIAREFNLNVTIVSNGLLQTKTVFGSS